MVLTDKTILWCLHQKDIEISPFDKKYLNPNTVDLTLNEKGLIYTAYFLDCKGYNHATEVTIHDTGSILEPGELYLFSTNEKISINSREICASVCGKSSLGRLGMQIHMTAGFIDTGFSGNITLEVTVVKPLKIYRNMPVCQIRFDMCSSEVLKNYQEIETSKYKNDNSVGTVPSRMEKNKFF